MSEFLIVAAEAGHARFYTYLPASSVEAREGPMLEKVGELVHPARKPERGRTRPGLARRPGPHSQSYDEHVNQQRQAMEEAFAREVVGMTTRLAAERKAHRLVLIAGPRFLGVLRPYERELEAVGLRIVELGKDFARLTRKQILDHLDAAHLVPQPGAPPAEAARILRTGREGAPDRT